MPMSELQPKTDYLANNWWHLIAEFDSKLPEFAGEPPEFGI